MWPNQQFLVFGHIYWRNAYRPTLGSETISGCEKLCRNDEKCFFFMSKALSVFKIFKFLFRLFAHIGKRLDKKVKVNLKIYDVTDWKPKNFNRHISQYLKKYRQAGNYIGQLVYNVRNIFVQISCRKWGRETRSRPLFGF